MAYILDAIFVQIFLFIVFAVIGAVTDPNTIDTMSRSEDFLFLGIDLVLIILIILYYALFIASGWQATPGKKLLGLHVIRADGQKIGFWRALGRYLAYFPSSLTLGLGFFMIGWSREKRALHDFICGTRVVRGKPRARILATVFD